MTDHYLTSTSCKQQEPDEDLVGAGLVILAFIVFAAAVIIASGLWTHVLAMMAGAWLHKKIAR